MQSRVPRFSIAIALMGSIAAFASGQTPAPAGQARLTGRVADAMGYSIPKAEILVTNTALHTESGTDGRFEVTGGGERQSLKVALKPAFARVTVTSVPAGATVWADDRELGTTPLETELDAGRYTLAIVHPEFRRSLNWRDILKAAGETLREPQSRGYTLAMTVSFSALVAYISSVQQIVFDAFGAGRFIGLVFASVAAPMALASWLNSRVVGRYGLRRDRHRHDRPHRAESDVRADAGRRAAAGRSLHARRPRLAQSATTSSSSSDAPAISASPTCSVRPRIAFSMRCATSGFSLR
jgi:DHA1 family bicyclomycin/chloramphenicol resistance-like MFS transporter